MNRSTFAWPLILVGSGLALWLLTLSDAASPARLPLALWFLLFCPGMALARLLRVRSTLAQWTLAIALSVSLDGLIGAIFVYGQNWTPDSVLLVLIELTAGLSLLELLLGVVRPAHPALEVAHG